jgi:hypothetical protein
MKSLKAAFNTSRLTGKAPKISRRTISLHLSSFFPNFTRIPANSLQYSSSPLSKN